MSNIDGIILFSGGLDSLLAAKVLQSQGLKIQCVHFTSPFFGKADVSDWREKYQLDIQVLDASLPFVKMLLAGPKHGFGKTFNPCVDCKILMLALARAHLEKTGAKFIATGEVLGQRPMSQRRDSMDIIKRESRIGDLLLRPLCALHYPPTPWETCGLVDRSRLCGFTGRNRTQQLELARELGLSELPSPAGGCVLTECENGRRYWAVFKKWRNAGADPDWNECVNDFRLARIGRQFWRAESAAWLCMGRQKDDNAQLLETMGPRDITLKLQDFPGPIALCRDGLNWDGAHIREACEMLAAHSRRAADNDAPVEVSIYSERGRSFLRVTPNRHDGLWSIPDWESARREIRSSCGKGSEKRD